MTARHRLPGAMLLKVARIVLDERTLTTIAIPVLADLQQDVHDAGDSRWRRYTACLRGYFVFWRVVMAIPFADPVTSTGSFRSSLLVRSGGPFLIVLGAALLAFIVPAFGWFAFLVLPAGALFAVGLRRWNDRHSGLRGAADPVMWVQAAVLFAVLLPAFGWFIAAAILSGVIAAIVLQRWNARHPSAFAPIEPMTPMAEARINMSAIPVGGDVGGLIFVVGSLVIVVLGLPDVRWFVLGSMASGAALAASLFVWRRLAPPSSHERFLGAV
jgi:hypothetical protein